MIMIFILLSVAVSGMFAARPPTLGALFSGSSAFHGLVIQPSTKAKV